MTLNEELEVILTHHAKLYPAMEPTDVVKLIYQNEFGGGHLIVNEAACLAALRREYASVPKDPDALRSIPIGNGIVRVHLNALTDSEMEALGREFLESARSQQGSMSVFFEKLDVLRTLTAQGIFAFDTEELECYLSAYMRAGCPMVSHSQTYRLLYQPAYRIVKR